ncbi:MAG: RNA polymerase sigma factor [Mariniblastus sp.]
MASGDRNALATFYNFNFDVMLKEVRRCLGRDEQTCLDLVQDAMLKAIKSIKPISSEGQIIAWSRTVAKSVTYDWLRKRSRLKTTELSEAGPIGDESHIEDSARLVWIESELKSLPPPLQKMIELRYRLGWSLNRIGAKFGLKTGAVDGRIRRAVERLRLKACEEFND